MKVLSALACSMLLIGCASHPIRSTDQISTSKLCTITLAHQNREECEDEHSYHLQYQTPSSDERPLNTKIFILEINDQGIIVNQETAQAAIKHIHKEMIKPKQQRPLVSLFVHGWNNDAKATNSDLINFEQAVLAFNDSQTQTQSNVIGIYVSWRGKTMPIGLSHALTFWSRKAISEEVGRGELANFIFELEAAVKPHQNDDENGKLILAGHSFGASALYNAVGHTLTARFYDSLQAQTRDHTQPIKGVGDLVILLNPAIQALRFRGLREAVYENAVKKPEIFKNNKAPIFVVLASEDDFAVETAFPIGRSLTQITSHHADDKMKIYQGIHGKINDVASIKSAERTSIGFYVPYYTHFLLRTENTNKNPPRGLLKLLNTPRTLLVNLANPSKDQAQKFNIASCLNPDVLAEFSTGLRDKIDWLEETYQSKNALQHNIFYTQVPSKISKQPIDLLRLRITNNPAAEVVGEDVFQNWPLLQRYDASITRPLSWPRNPYWFMKAKVNVMQGHNGIWNENVGCLLLSLMATDPISFKYVQNHTMDNVDGKSDEQQQVGEIIATPTLSADLNVQQNNLEPNTVDQTRAISPDQLK